MDLTNFERFGTSPLYLAKTGLQAAIAHEVGIGFLEINASRKDSASRKYGNQLDLQGYGRIVQNSDTNVSANDHNDDGFWMTFAYNLKAGNLDFQEPVSITEKHLEHYLSLYEPVQTSTDNNKPKLVRDIYCGLKSFALELHHLTLIVSQDYIGQDTRMASIPFFGRRAKKRQDSARISTGVFDDDTNYFFACYKSNFAGETIEKETYPPHRIERQLSLFNPPVDM